MKKHVKTERKLVCIAGTDTGVGKSVVTGMLSLAYLSHGHDVGVMKPVQTGAPNKSGGDVGSLRRWIGQEAPVENVYSFSQPVSPHIASALARRKISSKRLISNIKAFQKKHSIVLLEGIGGLFVPLRDHYTLLDLIRDIKASVILVAPNRLGVLNQTLLSVAALKQNKIPLLGIFLNHLHKSRADPSLKTNRSTLEYLVKNTRVEEIPYIAGRISRKKLLKLVQQSCPWKSLGLS